MLLGPVLVLFTIWRTWRDGGKRYLLQRFGFGYHHTHDSRSTSTLWVHAASVGEVYTVLPLLKRIGEPLLVTTMSPTGAKVLQQQQLAHVTHVYLPLDFAGACRRFMSKMNIREGWIVETEIWPWLYATSNARSTPLTIINARLSLRTSKQADGLLASTYAKALASVRIMARSGQDATGFAKLGAATDQISVVGNLKYANPESSSSQSPPERFLQRPYVLAASTHDDEEIQLARQWNEQLATVNHGAILVIVPRHPERGAAIIKSLSREGIKASLRSDQSEPKADSAIYVADTLGELQAWYSHATACFVGGSLISRGGHNMLEPARANCPVTVGPQAFNFQDIVNSLLDVEAIVVAKDAVEVISFLNKALDNPQAFSTMIQRAREQAKHLEGVVDSYLERLLAK